MIKEVLEKSIKTALWSLKIDESKISKISIEHPDDLTHGDYSCNIAMVLAKQVSQNPRELAEKIVAEINERKPEEISKIEVAGPGFINFYLSTEFFIEQTKEILKTKNFGLNKNLKGEKTVVEYTDPNPFKEFHIGHLMSNAVGEAISRIVEANGAKIIRVCYQGDVGLHVAKTIWGIEQSSKGKKISFKTAFELGQAYVLGATSYEENEIKKNEIVDINKKIYDCSDKEVNKIYNLGRKISLKYFEDIYKILGTKFDNYFFESKTWPVGKQIVEKNIGKVFEKSEGAIIFKGENHGLHTRVFINKEGLPTYEAKELGLAKIKYDKTKYSKSIVVTGNEIDEYFKVLLKAMSLIFPELASKTIHISHGMLRLPEGKMSSRTGDVITAVSLIDDIKQKVTEKMSDREMNKKEKEEIAQKVAIGALKYSILKQVNGKDIIFDFDKSISFEGDSGPYLQYSYARAKSILRKADKEGVKPKIYPSQIKNAFDGASITILEKLLYRFPEVVERAGNEYSPHYIATYLIELASSFNSFYAMGKIVDKADIKSPYKVALTETFSIVLKNGLNLLGIQTPEKM
ncbi:MAG: arginine--tRNA ligase [bacterium]